MCGSRQERLGLRWPCSDLKWFALPPRRQVRRRRSRWRHPQMSRLQDVLQLRVRYSETDQMGTFYNSRALEWFECGRTELMRRRLGLSYAELEAKDVFLPLVEAHLEFQGGARYDDLLDVASTVEMSGARETALRSSNHSKRRAANPSCAAARFTPLPMPAENRFARRRGFWN